MYLSWLPPESSKQNGIIQNYIVSISESISDILISTQIIADTNATIADLHPYYSYEIQVSAVTIASGPITEILFTTEEDGKY